MADEAPVATSDRQEPLRVAYVMSRFPKLTETFVLFEMLAVERQGVAIELFPLLRERSTTVHPEAVPLVERARFLPFLSWSIIRSQVWFLRHRPRRYLRTIGEVVGGTWGSPNFLIGGLGILPKVAHAARLMRAAGVDHVHCHFANHPALAGYIIHRLVGIPYSFTAHGSDLHVDRHMLCQKVAAADFVVAVSEDNRRVILDSCPAADGRVRVIHCGVDTSVFRPVDDGGSGTTAQRPLLDILSIGTLHEVKGQSVLVEACRLLAERGVGVRIRFVGEGPDRAMLEERIAAANLGPQVELLGTRTRAEIAALLASTDVVVAPSVPTRGGKREGIPVVLMEAMASGIPVVASRLSGIPELVIDGQNGKLFAPGDATALADLLGELAADPGLRERLGRAGRNHGAAGVRHRHERRTARRGIPGGRMRRGMFWLLGAVIGWTYVGFPLVVLARGRWRRRPIQNGAGTPRVSVVIAAHNEASVIGRRVQNLLDLDYPADRLEVIVASDGSTDSTVATATAVASDRARVLDLDRVGKADALNAAVAVATGEILVFSDANSEFAQDAIRNLTRAFTDPTVGGVAGDQRYAVHDEARNGAGERQYWDLDRRLKQAESAAGNVISATGAIYAIRRELFEPVAAGVTDDFFTSTAVIAQGRRLVFAGDAVAFEPVARDDRAEFGRKVRVMTRGLRGVVLRRALLDPRRHGFYAIQLATHKVLRRVAVFPLIGLAIVSPTLWRRGTIYQLATLGQGAGYVLAAAGLLLADRPLGRRKWLAVPAFFVWANVAALQAVANLVRGRKIDRWDPNTARSATPSASTPTRPDPSGPILSIVIPVNAQGDLANVGALLGDLDAYRGPHRTEVVLVVNNYPPETPPVAAVDELEGRGARVLAIPALRRPGEAIGFTARIPGARAALSPWLVSFDADCRIPDATSLLDWYVEAFRNGAAGAYSHVGYRDVRPGLSIKARLAAHHGARWVKRNVLGIPTVRGSNYGVRRDLLLQLYDDGLLADDMNIGPVLRHLGQPVAYSGDRRHVVLTSGRMFRGGWRKLGRYLLYRWRYNRRVLPVREGAARYTGRVRDPDRTFIDGELQ